MEMVSRCVLTTLIDQHQSFIFREVPQLKQLLNGFYFPAYVSGLLKSGKKAEPGRRVLHKAKEQLCKRIQWDFRLKTKWTSS
jgi:hypothetical protein